MTTVKQQNLVGPYPALDVKLLCRYSTTAQVQPFHDDMYRKISVTQTNVHLLNLIYNIYIKWSHSTDICSKWTITKNGCRVQRTGRTVRHASNNSCMDYVQCPLDRRHSHGIIGRQTGPAELQL